MNRRIKVLQLQPDYNVKPSDVSDLAEQIVKALPVEQFEVTSGYLSGKPEVHQPSSIAEHKYYFELSSQDMRGLRLKALYKLYRYCSANRFDVIICNRFKVVSMMLLLNKWLKTPLCIGISHVLDEYRRKYRQYQVGLLADRHWQFVGVSDAVRDWLIRYGTGFRTNNTHSIPNAIDIRKAESIQLSQQAAREILELPKNVRIIGCIGQLFARKGHKYLISALANLKDKYPEVNIGIIGRGREESNLKQQINQLGLDGRVHLLGFQENALQYAKAFDIWAMPSLKEGLPLALMEGMSAHLPVIASNIPEMRELIIGAGGIAVPPEDVESLTQALDDYLALPDTALRTKGEEAFRYLIQHHSIESYHSQYRNLIETYLPRHSRFSSIQKQ